MKEIKLKINNAEHRRNVINALAENGYMVTVKVEKADRSYRQDQHYVVVEIPEDKEDAQ